MGPLSGKQQREWVMLEAKKRREDMAFEKEQARKDELHQIKLASEVAKAAQGVLQKHDTHSAKMEDLKVKPTDTTKVMGMLQSPLGKPSNPEAGPSDTVPAMLTPGEAVIPAEAAQDPKNKPIIEALVEEGRGQQGYSKGTKKVKPRGVGGKGSRNSVLPKLPTVNSKGYSQGTTEVKEAPLGKGMAENARKAISGRQRQLDQLEEKAVKGYAEGTPGALTDEEVKMRESGGNPYAKNPKSSALGLYQMTEAARKDAIKYKPELANLPYLENQESFREGYKLALNDQIKKKGVEPTDYSGTQAWVVGADGYANIRNAEPNTPLEAILSKEAIANNPNLRGKTAGMFLNDPDPYSRVDKPKQAPLSAIVPVNKKTPQQLEGELALTDAQQAQAARDAAFKRSRLRDAPKNQAVPTAYKPEERAQLPNQPLSPIPTKDVTEGLAPIPKPGDGVDITKEAVAPSEAEDKVVSVLEDPEKQAILQMFQENAPPENASKEEKESFLQKMISSVWGGENSLFAEEDLARFAIVAAGGLLTGGSMEGSLRYAARDVLAKADAKMAGRQASRAEELKNQRELNETLDGRVAEYLAKNVPPEVRAKALELKNAKAKTMGEMIANKRQAVEFLAANVQQKDSDSKIGQGKFGYLNGKETWYYDVNGQMLIQGPQGLQPVPKGARLIPDEVFRSEKKDAMNRIEAKVGPKLRESMGKDYNDDYKSKVAADFELMYVQEFSGMDPASFAKVVETTINTLPKGTKITGLEEALRRGVYAHAVFNASPTGGALMRLPSGENPSVRALGEFGSVVKQAASSQDLTIPALSQALNEEWNKTIKENPKIKDKYTELSKASQNASDSASLQNMSPFMIWAMDKLQAK